jgi:hypothetical protein
VIDIKEIKLHTSAVRNNPKWAPKSRNLNKNPIH